MKKFILTGFIGISLLNLSCSSVKKASDAQETRAEVLKMKGNWQIVSVDYDKQYKIKPFDEGADAQCFVGSQWKLIPNNYTGSYALSGGADCPTFNQPIKFDVKNNVFSFKKIADGTKAKQNISGYNLTLINSSTDTFALEQNVPFEGENVKVIYNFQRVN
ncbi:Lipocalin-like domain-containing protein [Chryseobacterium piscicola]|uniref:Lipocalin-like domain-containing protein n=1 Tax=Chryseobacterium piscicola TaxID=551459 RepID=A0A1N7NWY2_9FLAO|nr:lipocalin family protein [Chryseobacterium piscicola]PQA94216.1 hypothetical protein B0A70_08100 [Chryseobacterium piscicola]SIT02719.1 Lipocalin-like domain-containing protein [Chryseobacterium piscicola]